MRIGVPKEVYPGEHRVALVPSLVPPLEKAGHEVFIEEGAGFSAGFPDAFYREKGAKIASREDVFSKAEIILQVRAAGAAGDAGHTDLERLRSGQVVIAATDPLGNAEGCKP